MRNVTQHNWLRQALIAGLSTAGLAICFGLVRSVAAADLMQRLGALWPLWPALFGLEIARAGCELWTTHALLGPDALDVPRRRLLRAQCLAFAINTILPAGRAAGEAAKAAVLSGGPDARSVGAGSTLEPARAFAVGVATQTLVLAINAGVALIGAGLALASLLAPGIAWALASYALLTGALAALIVFAGRSCRLRSLAQRWPTLRSSIERFDAIARERRGAVWRAALAQVAARCCQAAQLGVLMRTLGAVSPALGASGAWLAEALCVVGGAAGDLVPAQLGALDGVLALGAPGLGLTAAAVVVLGLVLHAVQLAAALVSGVAAASLSFAPLPRSHPSPVPQT